MKPVTILAIDDSPTILRVVQTVLARAGYTVHTAADGEEGLRLAHELRPDLVLLDFVMPKMNGYQVCRALADAEDTRAIPVVLMSAKGDEVGERFVKVMGSVAYITKPFAPEQLLEVVTEADCVVIVTDHRVVDYKWVVENAKLVVDTRNATRPLGEVEKVVRL